jgi:hypothetical protein
MPKEDVRQVLLRILFDGEFHHLVVTDPDKALATYNLTDEERAELKNPGRAFFALLSLLSLSSVGGIRFRDGGVPPPVTTTTVNVTTVNTTTINTTTVSTISTVTANTWSNPYNFVVNDALRLLGTTIRNSDDQKRFNLILDLLRMMSGDER